MHVLSSIITYGVKLLNADWLRQRALFLTHEGTLGNQEGRLIDADWLSTPAFSWLPASNVNGF